MESTDDGLPEVYTASAAELAEAFGFRPRHPTARGPGGQPPSPTRLTARELRAIELTAAGATYEQVGKVLGIQTRTGARQLVERALARREREIRGRELAAARALQIERLETLHRRWFPPAVGNPTAGIEPNARAAMVILSIHDRLVRLLQLETGPVVNVEVNVGLTPEEEADRLERVISGLAEVAARHGAIEGEFREEEAAA